VLGELAVHGGDDELVSIAGAKERRCLGVLIAAAPNVVSVDRLIEWLWDGNPPQTAHKSLQAHIVRLRSALEPERAKGSSGRYVVRRGSGYALAVGRADIDALSAGDLTARGRAELSSGDPDTAFRQLSTALELWRGEPYTDWPEAEFADAERRRLAEVRVSAVTGLLEAQLALGRQAEVIPELQRLLVQEPLREGWWSLLMLALYRDNRQAEALAAGRRVRVLLAEELGVDPGPGVRRLEQAILDHDPMLDPIENGRIQPAPTSASLPDPAQSAAAAPGVCPYRGLAAYQASDAALFRGRQRLVTDLVRRLVDTRVLVVSGPSGAGKSSLVRAGLIPALASGGLPGSSSWPAIVLTPGGNPVDALADLTGQPGPPAPVVLVCDQFEELWAPGTDAAERDAFLDTLLGLIDDEVVARCVAVVRGDHVGRLAEHAAFAERLAGALVLVPPLTDPELRDVVTEPARAAGVSVESELLDVAVADVVGRVGALPLFSMALVGTWERRRGDVLTLAGYLEAGGVAGALTRSAESAFGDLDAEGQHLARSILVRLADSEESGPLVRRPIPLSELAFDGPGGPARRDVVESFVRRRLLAVDDARLEVAHEALLTQWPRLARWLDDDAVGRTVRRHFAPAALAWHQGGRPSDELYRGARLGAALDWSAQPDADVTAVEREFLDLSRDRAESELRQAQDRAEREATGRRRIRRLAAGLAGVLAVALVAAGLAVNYQRAANARALEAEANRLAVLSTTVGSLDQSLLLAAQAVQLADTPDTEDGLLAALLQHRRAARVVPLTGNPQAALLGNKGRSLFIGVGDFVNVWDVDAETPVRSIDALGTDRWVASDASPTGELLAGGGSGPKGPWILVEDGDNVERFRLEGNAIGGVPIGLSYSDDGRRLRVVVATPAARGSRLGWRWNLKEIDPSTHMIRPLGPSGSFQGTQEWINATFADDGGSFTVWTAEAGGVATWVDTDSGRQVRLRTPPRDSSTLRVLPLSTGLVAQLWTDGVVALYDPAGAVIQLLDDPPEAIRDLVVSPDGTWGAGGGDNGGVVIWDIDPGTGRWNARETLRGHDGEVVAIDLDPSGQTLFTVSQDGTVIAWDMSPDAGFGRSIPALRDRWISNRPQVVTPRLVVAPTRPVSRRQGHGAFGPESDTLRVAATFIDPTNGGVVDQVEVGDTGESFTFGSSVAVSPDRTKVAVTSGLATTVLDTRTRDVLGRIVLPAPKDNEDPFGQTFAAELVWCSAWTPDGSRLLIGAEGSFGKNAGALVVVDPATWKPERRIALGAPQTIEFSPNHKLLAVAIADSPQIKILDADSYRVLRTLTLESGEALYDLSFSHDGLRLAAGGHRGLLHVFDTTTWRPTFEPVRVHNDELLQVEWTPDDRTVISSGVDGTVVLLDVTRARIRAEPFSGSSEPGQGYTYLIPGSVDELVVLGGDRAGHRYPMQPAKWLARACTVAGRNLTDQEWSRYIPGLKHRDTCQLHTGE
jgi:DNA-binding SARP family transcriptional activator/WD40 repeat protein